MEEVQRSYSRLCKESGAEPQETVLQRLHELPRGRLDLATQSLTVDSCRALGKLLQKETLVTELILSDCMLSEEGGRRGPAGAKVALCGLSRVRVAGNRLCLGAAFLALCAPCSTAAPCCSIPLSFLGRWPLVLCSYNKQQCPLKRGSRGTLFSL